LREGIRGICGISEPTTAGPPRRLRALDQGEAVVRLPDELGASHEERLVLGHRALLNVRLLCYPALRESVGLRLLLLEPVEGVEYLAVGIGEVDDRPAARRREHPVCGLVVLGGGDHGPLSICQFDDLAVSLL
jgi:hypothetical protein